MKSVAASRFGIKQCTSANPWEAFAAIYKKGDKVSGQIKSITDFGIFIGLEGGIDGLVHLSDISWAADRRRPGAQLQEGRRDLEAVVLAVDPERERISLGIKQLEQDPFGQFMANHPRGSILTGTVREVDAKGVTIDIEDGIEGYLRANDIAKERVDDATLHFKVGDTVEAKFTGMDRKGRVLQLSIRAKDEEELQSVLDDYQSSTGATTQLGALLKEKFNRE
jgi:small subunit ribosomal protein S1